MKKYIIVFYSRTGVSKKAAYRLYELLGGESAGNADIEEIIDLKNRSGVFGWLASLKDSFSDNITKIEAVKHPPSGYLETIIITPVWAGKMSDAVRTYLATYKGDIRALTLITCAGGSTGETTQKDIFRRFALKSRLISLKQKEVLSGNIDEYLKEILCDKNNGEGSSNNNEI